MYALHFSLSLGLLVGPFVIEPLAQTHVPKVVQNLALPKSLQEANSSMQPVLSTTQAYHDNYHQNHRIIKRGIISPKIITERNVIPSNNAQRIPSIPKSITPDPLLAKLFADSRIIHTRLVTKP